MRTFAFWAMRAGAMVEGLTKYAGPEPKMAWYRFSPEVTRLLPSFMASSPFPDR